MGKTLLLTSQGLVPEVRPVFLKLLTKLIKDCSIGYIPNAGDVEKDSRYINWTRNKLQKLGFNVIDIDLKKLKGKRLKEKLRKVDIIFVEGGNTFYLLKCMRGSGFNKIVSKLLDDGKIYVGISAGSIVTGPTINTGSWRHGKERNIVKLKNLRGLNLVPFCIFPHFTNKDKKLVKEKSKTIKYPLVALSDKQAVLVEGKIRKIIGTGKKISFNNFREKD